jgi:GAF domain-containing protein
MATSSKTHGTPAYGVGRLYTERLNFLMDSSAILASCLNKLDIFDRLAHAAVPFLADWCSIIVLEGEEGAFSRVAAAHVDPALDRRLHQILNLHLPKMDAKTGIPLAIRTGKSELLRQVTPSKVLSELSRGPADSELVELVSHLGLASMLTAPLKAHDQILGAISMAVGSERQPYEPSDLVFAEELSRRAALSLYSLNQIERAEHDRDLLEIVIRLYQNFIISRVEDTKTPLTAAKLKVDLLAKRLLQNGGDPVYFKKIEEDFDRAIASINTLAGEEVLKSLLKEASVISARKAA